MTPVASIIIEKWIITQSDTYECFNDLWALYIGRQFSFMFFFENNPLEKSNGACCNKTRQSEHLTSRIIVSYDLTFFFLALKISSMLLLL